MDKETVFAIVGLSGIALVILMGVVQLFELLRSFAGDVVFHTVCATLLAVGILVFFLAIKLDKWIED